MKGKTMKKLTCALFAIATAALAFSEDASAQRFGRNAPSFNGRGNFDRRSIGDNDDFRNGGIWNRRNDKFRGDAVRGPKLGGLKLGGPNVGGPAVCEPNVGGPIGKPSVSQGDHYHVNYHMEGTRTRHFDSDRMAHQFARRLEAMGLHAKVQHGRGCYDVVYHMHGNGSKTFGSHAAAHAFVRRLEQLGVHAKVVHH